MWEEDFFYKVPKCKIFKFVCDYFAFMLCSFMSYGMCRTGNLILFDCLFALCYSLNDAGRIIVLGGGICSAPYRIFYFVLFHFNFELPQLC